VTGSLARRYARALLELAREDGSLAPTGDELGTVAAVFDEPRLRAVVLNPAIDAGARKKVVSGVVEALGVSPWVGNLVKLLADRDRLTLLGHVAQAYDALVDAEVGRSRVRIRSAAPLGPSERAEVTDLAKRLVGTGDVLVATEVDADLLGGVVLDVGGTVWDGSLRTQLTRMSKQMAESGS
jgi:F-type H+-transporting ATPase subunit delta